MKRLILTSLSGLDLMRSGLAEVVIPFTFRFVSGPLPSPAELATYLAARTEKLAPGSHWSDFVGGQIDKAGKQLALVEFCGAYETIELWFDPDPNDQLQLIWLLDCLSSHPQIAARLRLRLVDFDLITANAKELARWKVPDVDVTAREFEAARQAWQAWQATTPEACFDLLGRDLSALPLLRPALLDLLEELPSGATGLGATEMRLLELVARGYSLTNALLHLPGLQQRRVFDPWEAGSLLEALAHGPRPAVAGLDDALRTVRKQNYRARDEAYKRSRLSLTEFGKSILAHKEDFSRHNPIEWGCTRLTNDRMWRWYPTLMKPSRSSKRAAR
jgi:hypothetical protein